MKQIRTFWFDLGNVILYFDFTPAFQKVSRYTDQSPGQIRQFFKREAWMEAALDEGKISDRKLFRMLDNEFGFRGLSFERFEEIWNRIFTPNRPVVRLIQRLKKKGYRLVLISNTNAMHFRYLIQRYRVLKCFDSIVLSYRIRARKPSPKIYRHALKRSFAHPQEIFYTDDRKDLVRAARKNHGVHSHAYRLYPRLIKTLRQRGVPV